MSYLQNIIAYLRHDTTTGIQLDEMDAFRGWACLGVVFYHCNVESGWGRNPGGVEGFFYMFLWPSNYFGWMGLDIFFFLSGFLLYMKFGKAHLENRPRPSLRSFYKRRFLRIAPAYYAAMVILLSAGIMLYGSRVKYGGPYDILAHVFFLQNNFTQYSININGVFWTLALEFQFYLILPFIAAWFYGGRWRIGLFAVLAGVAVFKAALLYYCTHYQTVQFDAMFPPLSIIAWRLDQFVVGMAFCDYWLMAERGIIKNHLKENSSLALLTGCAGFTLLASLTLYAFSNGGLWTVSGLWSSIYRVPLVSFSIGLIIMGTLYSGILKKILANPVIEFIGVISYSLYIWHYVVIAVLQDKLPFLMPPGIGGYKFASKFVFLVLVLVVSISGSVVYYILFERPFLKKGSLLKNMFRPAVNP